MTTGILNRASQAREETIVAGEKEQISMAWNGLMTDKAILKNNEIDNENFENELKKNGNNVKVENGEDTEFSVTFIDTTHEFIVDRNGNVSLKGSKIIVEDEDMTIGLTADTIVNSGNASNYFGKYVTNYVANTENGINYNNYNESITDDEEKWRIFYIGDAGNGKNQIYLISSNYIHYDKVPMSKNGFANIKYSDYRVTFSNNVLSDYSKGSDDISKETEYLNKQLSDYLSTANSANTTNTMKKTAYMCDNIIWDCYANKYADFAIGGPTLELIIKSYNERYHSEYKENYLKEKYQTKINNGYYYSSFNGGESFVNGSR